MSDEKGVCKSGSNGKPINGGSQTATLDPRTHCEAAKQQPRFFPRGRSPLPASRSEYEAER